MKFNNGRPAIVKPRRATARDRATRSGADPIWAESPPFDLISKNPELLNKNRVQGKGWQSEKTVITALSKAKKAEVEVSFWPGVPDDNQRVPEKIEASKIRQPKKAELRKMLAYWSVKKIDTMIKGQEAVESLRSSDRLAKAWPKKA